MKTRQQAITYGLTFPHTYVESPFKDPNWELVRVKGSKKAFLWVYEKDGYINLNIKVDPEWREFWREAYDAVIPGYLRRDYSRKRHQKNDQRKLRYHHGQSDKKNLRSSQTNSKRACGNLWTSSSHGRKSNDVTSSRKCPA